MLQAVFYANGAVFIGESNIHHFSAPARQARARHNAAPKRAVLDDTSHNKVVVRFLFPLQFRKLQLTVQRRAYRSGRFFLALLGRCIDRLAVGIVDIEWALIGRPGRAELSSTPSENFLRA